MKLTKRVGIEAARKLTTTDLNKILGGAENPCAVTRQNLSTTGMTWCGS